ncbi:MAG: NAD-dependent epimerase/dehydratase family protein [Saonia sp.]
MTERILVTGAGGQLGRELIRTFVAIYGEDAIIASDIDVVKANYFTQCHFEPLNIFDTNNLHYIIRAYKVTQIYHLAAILSAAGEQDHHNAWQVNVQGLINVLEAAKEYKIKRMFWPSSIAVFGRNSPKRNTPQYSVTDPITGYGIAKVAGELWCQYYYEKLGLDVRSLRYPGLIGHRSLPGGGTTDYAVDIYHHAVQGKKYTCYLKPDTRLPMLYMPDAIKAALDLMQVSRKKLSVRTSYNLAGMSFTPAEIYRSIGQFYPNFQIEYKPDFRKEIADTWPESIDDSKARTDWGWKPKYDLDYMTVDMLEYLEQGPKRPLLP